jgi:parallel beta-helix repeat protein
MMVIAAACGRTDPLDEVDPGSPDTVDDPSVGSDTDGDLPTEPGSDEAGTDARMPGVNPTDAGDARTDANDAQNANDARTDASDARSAIDASADAGDARTDASDTGYAFDATDANANDGNAKDGAADGDAGAPDGARDARDEPCPVAHVYVDAVHGLDTSDGSAATPFKTITQAIAVAAANTCIDTIYVSAGTYDVINGEVFPLRIPPNVALIGDEANKGLPDAGAVFILGFGPVQPYFRATILPSSGATIAGFEITAPLAYPDPGEGYRHEVLLFGPTAGVTVRNNTIVGLDTNLQNGTVGIYVRDSTNNLIVGNVLKGNTVGLFNGGTASSKVESNVMTGNLFGVETDAPGADLGGGAFGSAGLNTIACNEQNLWTTAPTQPASNEYWDHVPPTMLKGMEGHADIYTPTFVTMFPITTGAMLAPTNCP